MITLAFYQSVEFYVIAFLVASVVVAFAMKPQARGEARTHLLAGELSPVGGDTPAIRLEAMDSGYVRLVRDGIEGVSTNGAVSLAVTMIGFDITIEERLVRGNNFDINAEPAKSAEFLLDFLGRERYHIRYNSDSTGLFAVTTLNNRPGYKAEKTLTVKS